MLSQRATELLFLTNFSDACFRATRAVAQMADDMEVGLTLLYACDPAQESRRAAEEKLRSFFPEADRYRVCRRVVYEGDVVSAVADIRARRRIDLAIAPVADRFTYPRFFHASIRTRLVVELGVSVWTSARGVSPAKLGARVRNVACVLDGGTGHDKHLEAASEYAAKVGATLHFLHVMPEIEEGTLFEPTAMLSEAEVEERAARMVPATRAEIHVSPGGGTRELRRLVTACDADLLFMDQRRAIQEGPFSSRLSRIVDVVPCPTVCVSKLGWPLQSDAGPGKRARVREEATARAERRLIMIGPGLICTGPTNF